jgi:hypothetical protein
MFITDMQKNTKENTAPIHLKIISIILILMGLSGFISNYMLENNKQSLNEDFQIYLESRNIIDLVSPYILSALLIISAVLMFKGRKISLKIYLAYVVTTSIITLIHFFSTTWYEYYGIKGIAATAFSLSITIIIYFYLRHLDNKGRLNS